MNTPIDLAVNRSVRCNQCGAAYRVCDCRFEAADLPVATHSGEIRIGTMTLRCHVLSDGNRVIDTNDLEGFFS